MVTADLPVIQTIGLTKIFKDFWGRNRVVAVDNLDLEVMPGEVFGLLGPNGSGKTTTIKILLGLLYPTRGRAAVFGKLPTDVAVKARIGYLPEETYLYPFLDARETLDYYGQLFRQSPVERRRRTAMLLDMVGLTAAARRRIGQYSKGMARRIGLAQALINDPDLLLLDEPTSGMDPIGTRQIKDLIRELSRRGKTIIMCSHLLADVEDICDRVAILYGGKRRALGDIKALLARHELTQITTDRLSSETIERVRQLIETVEGKQVIDVSSPADKLEDFFLQIVQEARQQHLTTSGSESEGEVAEFLRASPPETGSAVVHQLVTAAQTDTEPVPAAQQPPPPTTPEPADQAAIDRLVQPAAREQTTDQEPTDRQPERKTPTDVDQSIIDSLIKRKTDQQKNDA